jgi:hypothetical protein
MVVKIKVYIILAVEQVFYSLMLQINVSHFRYQEEDRDLEAQMLAKGLRLTPLRKESHV